MIKVAVLSLFALILLLVSYFLGGVRPEACVAFKVIVICFAIIFLVSTFAFIYDLRKKKKQKIQVNLIK